MVNAGSWKRNYSKSQELKVKLSENLKSTSQEIAS